MSHRLKVVVGHVHHLGKMNSYAGCHCYLIYLNDSVEWMTIESSFCLNSAISNYGKKPQKYNPQYGLIAFTFTEYASFAQKSLVISDLDWGKA